MAESTAAKSHSQPRHFFVVLFIYDSSASSPFIRRPITVSRLKETSAPRTAIKKWIRGKCSIGVETRYGGSVQNKRRGEFNGS
jgi:hypothetical protein